MRFILQDSEDRFARADATMLDAMGLPGGGIIKIGDTHVRVMVGHIRPVNGLAVPKSALDNGAGAIGAAVEGQRAVLPHGLSVTVTGTAKDPRAALAGLPVTIGDSYDGDSGSAIRIVNVEPGPVAVVTSETRIVRDGASKENAPEPVESTGGTPAESPATPKSIATSRIAGLDDERDLLNGWLSLLVSARPERMRSVAGLVVAGPPGCGSDDLVEEAVASLGLHLTAVDLRTVTTADRLLTRLEAAIRVVPQGSVIFVDGLDPLVKREASTRHQAAAVMRWFLDKVAETPGLACVIASRDSELAEMVDAKELLPRTLVISPPNRQRRASLIAAETEGITNIDVERAANATAGFSGLDIEAAVLEARATTGGDITTEALIAAIGTVEPSLGSTSFGDIPSYGFDKVANLVDVKQVLTESVIWQLTEPERFERMGITAPKGILLHGPPGTGKTFVVRALANESGAAFFSVKGAELLDKWVGESERGVREVFARAKTVAPSIIFFDELDALAPARGSSSNSVTDSVVAALLTELDGVGDRGDVFAIGATNRIDLIDPALLRPGRLGVHVLLGLPAPEARAAFLAMTSVPMDDDVVMNDVVSMTEGASFADLEGMLRSAAILALRRDSHAIAVKMEELSSALPGHLR